MASLFEGIESDLETTLSALLTSEGGDNLKFYRSAFIAGQEVPAIIQSLAPALPGIMLSLPAVRFAGEPAAVSDSQRMRTTMDVTYQVAIATADLKSTAAAAVHHHNQFDALMRYLQGRRPENQTDAEGKVWTGHITLMRSYQPFAPVTGAEGGQYFISLYTFDLRFSGMGGPV